MNYARVQDKVKVGQIFSDKEFRHAIAHEDRVETFQREEENGRMGRHALLEVERMERR